VRSGRAGLATGHRCRSLFVTPEARYAALSAQAGDSYTVLEFRGRQLESAQVEVDAGLLAMKFATRRRPVSWTNLAGIAEADTLRA
jgi:hypothetical protein